MFNRPFLLLLILATGTFEVLAGEVYKTVDENGNTVFSDKKTHDAETINVQPNVVGLDIPDMPASSSQQKSKKQASSKSGGNKSEVSGWNATNNSGNLKRRVRTETNGDGVNRNKPASAPGVRAGGR